MEECSLDLIFLIRDRPFFLVGGRGDFFRQLKLDIFDKVMSCDHKKSSFYNNCYLSLFIFTKISI